MQYNLYYFYLQQHPMEVLPEWMGWKEEFAHNSTWGLSWESMKKKVKLKSFYFRIQSWTFWLHFCVTKMCNPLGLPVGWMFICVSTEAKKALFPPTEFLVTHINKVFWSFWTHETAGYAYLSNPNPPWFFFIIRSSAALAITERKRVAHLKFSCAVWNSKSSFYSTRLKTKFLLNSRFCKVVGFILFDRTETNVCSVSTLSPRRSFVSKNSQLLAWFTSSANTNKWKLQTVSFPTQQNKLC